MNQEAENQNLLIRLWRGDVSLATTYWIWGVLGGAILNSILGAIASRVSSGQAERGFALVFLLTTFVYAAIVQRSIWLAAGRYHGPRIWCLLARTCVVMGAISLVVALGTMFVIAENGPLTSLMVLAAVIVMLPIVSVFWTETEVDAGASSEEGPTPGPTTSPASVKPAADPLSKQVTPVKPASSVIPEDKLWADALEEFDGINRKAGMWARTFSEAGGNEALAKAKYLAYRVAEMKRDYLEGKVHGIQQQTVLNHEQN